MVKLLQVKYPNIQKENESKTLQPFQIEGRKRLHLTANIKRTKYFYDLEI